MQFSGFQKKNKWARCPYTTVQDGLAAAEPQAFARQGIWCKYRDQYFQQKKTPK